MSTENTASLDLPPLPEPEYFAIGPGGDDLTGYTAEHMQAYARAALAAQAAQPEPHAWEWQQWVSDSFGCGWEPRLERRKPKDDPKRVRNLRPLFLAAATAAQPAIPGPYLAGQDGDQRRRVFHANGNLLAECPNASTAQWVAAMMNLAITQPSPAARAALSAPAAGATGEQPQREQIKTLLAAWNEAMSLSGKGVPPHLQPVGRAISALAGSLGAA